MTLDESVTNARIALRVPVERFELTCNCGWNCEETRRYLVHRVRRHFDWPDARNHEVVQVNPSKP